MKKLLFSISLMMLMASNVSAQLKVNSNGKVTIASSENFASANLTIGYNPLKATKYADLGVGLYSSNESNGLTSNSYGIIGRAVATNGFQLKPASCIAIGVMGVAENSTSGYSFGISGLLNNSSRGAAIYGSWNNSAKNVKGKYAGYFNGDTHVNGTLSATSLIIPSVTTFGADAEEFDEEDDVLGKIQEMNVVSYNDDMDSDSKDSEESIELLTDAVNSTAITAKGGSPRRHYGLLAQDLQRVYPDLVHEGQDGSLGINYVELVPILIRSIQELKAELDYVKGNSSRMEARSVSLEDETTDVLSSTIHRNVLYQNTPNPFKEQTVIRFKLADNVQNASICIFDMTGKMLKKLPISSDMESVSIGGYELGEGMFLYSMIINGQMIDTKRMVISK